MLYHIVIPEIYKITLHIEAANEESAVGAAMAILNKSDELESEYSHTLERDSWTVRHEPSE